MSSEGIVPRLLVSVRSGAEADSAIQGGVDILDLKEPERGPLGMVDLDVMQQVAARVRSGEISVNLSVALGELDEWTSNHTMMSIPNGVSYAKLGLSNAARLTDWVSQWQQARRRLDDARNLPLKWVAVAYADAEAANSPDLEEIMTAAVETGCDGLLVDTFQKTGRCLMDYVDASRLAKCAEVCHSAGLFLAIAGSLTQHRLGELRHIPVDIIAIRSAACRNSSRKGTVDSSNIKVFRQSMARAFEGTLVSPNVP